MAEWFEEWFGEEYLNLYPHRDDREAAEAVALISTEISLTRKRVLDLACGAGRHAVHLREAGADVIGFDLSMPLLSRARHRNTPRLSVARGDMRSLPFASGEFDVVVNLFTSFGYFAEDEQHRIVIREVARLLRINGLFVLDYFNAQVVLNGIVPREERRVGNRAVVIERQIIDDDRFVLKEIQLVDDGRRFVERVRLFSREELRDMLEHAGFRVTQEFGDYTGSMLTSDSPRVILFGRRA